MQAPIIQVSCDHADPESLAAAERIAEAAIRSLPEGTQGTIVSTSGMAKRARELLAEWSAASVVPYETPLDGAARTRNSGLAVQHLMATATAAMRLLLECTVAADALQCGAKSLLDLAGRAGKHVARDAEDLCPMIIAMRDACREPAPTAPGGDA